MSNSTKDKVNGAGTGRKKDESWDETTPLEGGRRVTCNYCSCEIVRKIERVKKHLSGTGLGLKKPKNLCGCTGIIKHNNSFKCLLA